MAVSGGVLCREQADWRQILYQPSLFTKPGAGRVQFKLKRFYNATLRKARLEIGSQFQSPHPHIHRFKQIDTNRLFVVAFTHISSALLLMLAAVVLAVMMAVMTMLLKLATWRLAVHRMMSVIAELSIEVTMDGIHQ